MKFWAEEAPEKLLKALETVETRYGAIVVDEGQDFLKDWWLPIELLNESEDRGKLYIFYDRHQNLFNPDLVFPDLPVRFVLPANCRNTRKIAGVCGSIRGIEMPVWSSAPVGESPKIVEWSSAEDCRTRVENIVSGWISKGQLKPNQIAILGPHAFSRSCLANLTRLGQTPITQSLVQWRQGKGVLYHTARAFKGLEADALVVVEVKGFSRTFTDADLYVACSRAKHDLVVLCASEDITAKLKGESAVVVDG
jgi:hypothetical protein